ncbi:hypothetical protein [Pseudovibrio sp. Tun.PSC04-5.I4]|uniref:hypothetical protein n=1 Tax=Pseudovibrio sp. Tun.PSC04-5.I4 TaxID=1798213 RepID=UPI000881D207|nr:hypothetical protein [Pseudovibrio sp. Tun.PSC04-5.I4]SDR30753.1 hypothetical protein SAMN04515695_4327 [Pseudovibrio sp. Tun.PSC04-5.I4]
MMVCSLKALARLTVLVSVVGLAACQMKSEDNVFDIDASEQSGLRQIQTRTFKTKDKDKALRSVMTTMQDMGFVIRNANKELGTVSGTKLEGYQLRMTVSVIPSLDGNMVVRANASYNEEAVDSEAAYNDYFSILEKELNISGQELG